MSWNVINSHEIHKKCLVLTVPDEFFLVLLVDVASAAPSVVVFDCSADFGVLAVYWRIVPPPGDTFY